MLIRGTLYEKIEFFRKLTRKGPRGVTFRKVIWLMMRLKFKMKVAAIVSNARRLLKGVGESIRRLLPFL